MVALHYKKCVFQYKLKYSVQVKTDINIRKVLFLSLIFVKVISEKERRILFSIWASQKTDDPNKIAEENKVKLIRKNDHVNIGKFGNEGAGSNAIQKYNWNTGTTVKFLVRGRPDPNDKTRTEYKSWYALEDNVWQLIACFSRPKSGGYLEPNRFYSFVEQIDYVTGYQMRKAYFGNQWARDSSGQWHELKQAVFGGDTKANHKVRLDIDAGVDNVKGFFMMSGGFFDGKTQMNKFLTRKATNIKPSIELNNLP